jgi:hypothetical protein
LSKDQKKAEEEEEEKKLKKAAKEIDWGELYDEDAE